MHPNTYVKEIFMKKIIAFLLAVAMLLCMVACDSEGGSGESSGKSKAQSAADRFLEDFEDLIDDLIDAYEDKNKEAFEALYEESNEMRGEFEELWNNLKKKDEEAADEFWEDFEDLVDELTETYESTKGAFAGSVASKDDLEAALAYIKTVYKNSSEKTPRDFQRIDVVPVNGSNLEIVWSVNVDEEHVKVVKGEDGMVTIDVNEQSAQDVPYVLTATISNADGESVSFSWNHLLPSVNTDPASIVEEAYQLDVGQSMDYEVTLTGVITRINTAWSDDYQNITVTIEVAGAEGKTIEVYRLAGNGAEMIGVNDTITVTGYLMNYHDTIQFAQGCTLDNIRNIA
jgi:rubrerythrin